MLPLTTLPRSCIKHSALNVPQVKCMMLSVVALNKLALVFLFALGLPAWNNIKLNVLALNFHNFMFLALSNLAMIAFACVTSLFCVFGAISPDCLGKGFVSNRNLRIAVRTPKHISISAPSSNNKLHCNQDMESGLLTGLQQIAFRNGPTCANRLEPTACNCVLDVYVIVNMHEI